MQPIGQACGVGCPWHAPNVHGLPAAAPNTRGKRTRPIQRCELMLFLRYGALSWNGISSKYLRQERAERQHAACGGARQRLFAAHVHQAADHVRAGVRRLGVQAGKGRGERDACHDVRKLPLWRTDKGRRRRQGHGCDASAGIDQRQDDVHQHVGPGDTAHLRVYTHIGLRQSGRPQRR